MDRDKEMERDSANLRDRMGQRDGATDASVDVGFQISCLSSDGDGELCFVCATESAPPSNVRGLVRR